MPRARSAGGLSGRMHGASGGGPKGNRNALKHGEFTANSVDLKYQISALDSVLFARR